LVSKNVCPVGFYSTTTYADASTVTARLRFFTNLFLSWWKHRHRSNLRCAALRSLWYRGPNAASNGVSYAMHYSRSHDALIRVYDEAGNVIDRHARAGGFKEWSTIHTSDWLLATICRTSARAISKSVEINASGYPPWQTPLCHFKKACGPGSLTVDRHFVWKILSGARLSRR